MTVIFVTEVVFGFIEISENHLSLKNLPWLILYQLGWLALMILVGISEELFSRGLQMKNLAEGLSGLGRWPSVMCALLLSSMFFALLHLGNPSTTLVSTGGILFAGLVLGLLMIRTERLALPMGLHFTWNYFQGPVFGFAVSGNETPGSIFSVVDHGPHWFTGGEFGPEAGMSGSLALLLVVVILLAWPPSLANRSREWRLGALTMVRYRPLRKRPAAIEPLAPDLALGAQQSETPSTDHHSTDHHSTDPS